MSIKNATVITAKQEITKEIKVPENLNTSGLMDFSSLLKFLDIKTLSQIHIDMDFLDSIAGTNYYGIGLSGDIFIKNPQSVSFVNGIDDLLSLDEKNVSKNKKSNSTTETKSVNKTEMEPKQSIEEYETNIQQTPKLMFPENRNSTSNATKTLELIFSDITPNLILLQAHRILKVHIGPKTPFVGSLLQTSCSLDEICLSDSIPEAGERYPNKKLEIEIETTRPPKIIVKNDLAQLNFIGTSTFYIADTRQVIGRIPFTCSVEISLKMSTLNPMDLKIPKMKILEDLDFFELSAETLSGFRDSIKGAIENMAKKVLQNGIDTAPLTKYFKQYGLNNFELSLLDKGLFLLTADVDVYKLVFETT